MLKQILKKKLNNDLLKNTVTLISGSILAQALPLAISPILTRLYAPEEFGVFALFMAIVSVLGVIATLRYEFAIVQQESEEDAHHLVVICILISLSIGLITLSLIHIFESQILSILENQEIRPWLHFIPLSIVLVGCFQSLNYWNNRNKKYKKIAASKIIQSSGTVTVNLLASKSTVSGLGLIVGYIVGQLTGFIYLLSGWLKRPKFRIKSKRIKALAKQYSKYPLLSSPGALVNSFALQAPVIFISRFFDIIAVGYFNFIYRIIGGPLDLISSSFSQVLLQKIGAKDYDDLSGFILKTAKKLLLLSLPMIIAIVLFGTEIFEFVFGERWAKAGDYAKIIIFSIAIRFIVSPLSMVLIMEQFIKWGFFWQIYTLTSVLVTFFLFHQLDFYSFLIIFVIQDVLSYSLYFILIVKAAKRV